MNKIVVFDLDGTLANIEHRRNYVATKPRNWNAFNAAIIHDSPYEDMVTLSRIMHNSGYGIILCSGRSDDTREVTEKQMDNFGVPFLDLFMRKYQDYRDDGIVKVELLHKIRSKYGEPFLWFDDRNRVVEAIRAEGVRVLQVAPGDF